MPALSLCREQRADVNYGKLSLFDAPFARVKILDKSYRR